MAWNPKVCFQFPPSQGIGLSGVVRLWRAGGQFLSLREAFILNLSLLVRLEALEKFLIGWWWSRPVLEFSLSQVEQHFKQIFSYSNTKG